MIGRESSRDIRDLLLIGYQTEIAYNVSIPYITQFFYSFETSILFSVVAKHEIVYLLNSFSIFNKVQIWTAEKRGNLTKVKTIVSPFLSKLRLFKCNTTSYRDWGTLLVSKPLWTLTVLTLPKSKQSSPSFFPSYGLFKCNTTRYGDWGTLLVSKSLWTLTGLTLPKIKTIVYPFLSKWRLFKCNTARYRDWGTVLFSKSLWTWQREVHTT